MGRAALFASLLFTGGMLAASSEAAPVYRLTLIPRLPNGQTNTATWINDAGVVTGQSNTIFFVNDNGQIVSTGSSRAYRWTEGANPVDLGTLGTVGQSTSGGNHITNSGDVVGFAENGEGTILTEATLFRSASAGGNQALGNLNDSFSFARSANESGQIVGNTQSNGIPTAFIHENGAIRSLIGRSRSTATGINESGQISGFYQSDAQFSPNQAFRARPDGSFVNLGALGTGTTSFGRGINDSGDVVGESNTTIFNRPVHAFLAPGSDGPLQDLGTLGASSDVFDVSVALSINNLRQIVGYSFVDMPGSTVASQRAFVFDGGVMLDLNTLVMDLPASFTLVRANSINASGQIVGVGDLVGGNGLQAYLLTPVPEPGAFAVLAVTPAWLLGRRRRV